VRGWGRPRHHHRSSRLRCAGAGAEVKGEWTALATERRGGWADIAVMVPRRARREGTHKHSVKGEKFTALDDCHDGMEERSKCASSVAHVTDALAARPALLYVIYATAALLLLLSHFHQL
jgi:hypothetical protein